MPRIDEQPAMLFALLLSCASPSAAADRRSRASRAATARRMHNTNSIGPRINRKTLPAA